MDAKAQSATATSARQSPATPALRQTASGAVHRPSPVASKPVKPVVFKDFASI